MLTPTGGLWGVALSAQRCFHIFQEFTPPFPKCLSAAHLLVACCAFSRKPSQPAVIHRSCSHIPQTSGTKSCTQFSSHRSHLLHFPLRLAWDKATPSPCSRSTIEGLVGSHQQSRRSTPVLSILAEGSLIGHLCPKSSLYRGGN